MSSFLNCFWNIADTTLVKKLPANAGDIRDMDLILGQEDPLEEGTETHSSILACPMRDSKRDTDV